MVGMGTNSDTKQQCIILQRIIARCYDNQCIDNAHNVLGAGLLNRLCHDDHEAGLDLYASR